MPEQEPLIPGDGGLWRAVLTHGAIDHAAWLRARAEGTPVGTCRRCGTNLHPERPYEHAGRTDYVAVCANPKCGGTIAAPGGRLFRGDTTAWSRSNGAARAAALAKQRREAA